MKSSAEEPPTDQLAAMQQIRGIQLAASSLYGQMHHAYSLPQDSPERELAMLGLNEQISDFLGLPGNTPATALLSVGRIAAEVAGAIAAKLGLTQAEFTNQLERHAINTQLFGK